MESQSKKNKRIAKNSFFLYFRMSLLLFIGLYTSRVTLDVFGVEDFGLYNLVGGIITISVFVSSSMALSAERFLAYAIGLDNSTEIKETFSMSVNIHVIIAAIILILGETIGLWFVNTQLVIPADRVLAANIIYQTSVISFIISIVATPYNSIIIANEQMNFFALVSILQAVLKLLFVIFLPFVNYDKLVVYSLLMMLPAVLYFCMNYFFSTTHYKECRFQWYWSKRRFYKMFSFAGYSTFGNMATAIVTQGQSVLLNIFYGPTLNAVRGLAMQVSVAVNSFVNGTYTAVNPQIIKSYAQKDYNYFHKLIYNSTIIGYGMLFLLSVPIFIEADFILGIWLKETPPYTVIFIRLMLINALIYNFVVPSWMAIQATGEVFRIHITTGIINLLNILITYIIWKIVSVPPYSIYIVNIFVSLCMQIATIFIQRKQLEINVTDYLKKVVSPVLVASLIAIIPPLMIAEQMEDGILSFFVVSTISVVCSIMSFYVFCLTPEIKTYIKDAVKKMYAKL